MMFCYFDFFKERLMSSFILLCNSPWSVWGIYSGRVKERSCIIQVNITDKNLHYKKSLPNLRYCNSDPKPWCFKLRGCRLSQIRSWSTSREPNCLIWFLQNKINSIMTPNRSHNYYCNMVSPFYTYYCVPKI